MKLLNKFSALLVFIVLTTGNILADGLVEPTLDISFPDKWHKTPIIEVILSPIAETVVPGQDFFIYMFVFGYPINDQGMTDIVMDVNIISPDSSIYYSEENMPVHNAKVIKRKLYWMFRWHAISLAENKFSMHFKENDSLGKYKIFITLKDRVDDDSYEYETEIELKKFERKKSGKINIKKTADWMQNYYKDPKPVAAYDVFLKLSEADAEKSFSLQFYSFFVEVFKDNDFLVRKLLEIFNEQSEQVRKAILTLLYYMNYDAPEFYGALPQRQIEYLEYLKAVGNPINFENISSQSQLNILWYRFFASGRFNHIRKIVGLLSYGEYSADLKNNEVITTTEQPILSAAKGYLFTITKADLQSYCIDHPLIRSYCIYIFANENLFLPEEVKKDLLKVTFNVYD